MFKRKAKAKKNDKLTQKEVETALARIRRSYDDYIVSCMTTADEKNGFEDRYISALHARVDLTRFIRDEIAHIQKLQMEGDAEKARLAAAPAVKVKKKPEMGFADKVMKQLEEKIEKYPELDFHKEASVEVRKLYGALSELDKTYWPVLATFIRQVHSSTVSYNFENRLVRMTSSGSGIPADLDRYKFLLDQGLKYAEELFREAQECIKRASFFLHDLRLILLECQDRGIMDDEVEIAFEYVQGIIHDFRLKDLKSG